MPHTDFRLFTSDAERRAAIEPVLRRAARLAARLVGGAEADALVMFGDETWRGQSDPRFGDDGALGRFLDQQHEPWWVEDARQDPLLRDHPLVAGERGVRFFAGAPLRVEGFAPAGLLRVVDTTPHPYDAAKAEGLREIADWICEEWAHVLSPERARLWKLLGSLKAREQELESALAANQAIFDYSNDVICTFDRAGVLVDINAYAETIWGYRRDELIGKAYVDFLHPDDVEPSVAHEIALRNGVAATGFVTRWRRADGEYVPMMWSSGWSEKLGRGVAIGRDMSERIAFEDRLRQAQKMEAMGRLTGGIAHDFNNLLTVLYSGAETLEHALPDRSPHRETASLMLQASQRGADLVRRLLAFARQEPLDTRPVDVRAAVRDTLPLLQRTLGQQVEIDVSGADLQAFALADAAQLDTALMNLCLNAADAMPEGGRIAISIERVSEPGAQEIPRAMVRLVVQDNGAGMAPEVQQRALEPFFTTKGKGSGLGLSTIYGFVRQCGGFLRITSAPGEGARIELYFVEAEPADLPQSDRARPNGGAVRRRVLLVEDDDLVRAHTTTQLGRLGYPCVPARNAAEALDLLGADERLQVLVTDIVMPGMNGHDLAERALTLRPDLKVLLVTGFSEANLRLHQFPVLKKPYRRSELAHALEDLESDARFAEQRSAF